MSEYKFYTFEEYVKLHRQDCKWCAGSGQWQHPDNFSGDIISEPCEICLDEYYIQKKQDEEKLKKLNV